MYPVMPLPYSFSGLVPEINQEVLTTHYEDHYTNYVNKLNNFITKSDIEIYSKEEIINNIDKFPLPLRGDILYNVGAVLNHELYFKSMNTVKTTPQGNLLNKINVQYGNFEEFRKDFINRAKSLVGSGYTFLVSNLKGDLTIINLVNQETPLSYGLIPLFTSDLWEHAYYLQYKNNRNSYIENFWNKANFNNAEKIYNEIVS